jgi:hypothetical protein
MNKKTFGHAAVITAATLTGLVLTISAATALSPTTPPNIQPPPPTYPEGNDFMTMKNDQANRSHDIHWPAGFDPERADLFSHNQLVINAPCERYGRSSSKHQNGRNGIQIPVTCKSVKEARP